ncbi:MAG: tyrosine-type recombinase/integrase [archaeon]
MITDDNINSLKKLIQKKRELKGKEDTLTKGQKETLLRYVKESINEGISPNTLKTKIHTIKNFIYYINKEFEEITKEDIKEFRNSKRNLKPGALNSLLSIIKTFFKWFYKVESKGKYPEIVEWIEVKPPAQSEIIESDLISFGEVRDILIPACHNFEDKCLISLLRETGARINEILKTNVSDVRLENDKAYIKLLNSKQRNGVKNYREVVLIDTYYYLQSWLRDHPLKKDFNKKKDTALFVNKKGKRLSYTNVYALLQKIKKESGFKKSINPHLFRHSQASDMAKILTDAELRVFGGWSKTSQIIARYTHITSDAVNEKRLRSIGRIKPEEKEISIENLKPCPRCNENVDYNKFKFCGKCGMSLSKEESIQESVKTEMLNKKVDKLFKQIKQIEKEKIMNYLNKK